MLPDSVIESLLASFSPDSTPKRPTALRSSTGGNDVFTAFLQRARARISDRPSDTAPTSDASAPRLVTSGAFNPTFVDVKPTSDPTVSDSTINKNGLLSGSVEPAEISASTPAHQVVSEGAQTASADAELEQILALLPRVVAELFGLDPAAQAQLLQSFAAAIEAGESLNVNPEFEADTQGASAQVTARSNIEQPVKQSAKSKPGAADQIASDISSPPAQQPTRAAIDPAQNQPTPTDQTASVQAHSAGNVNSAAKAETAGRNVPAASRKTPQENRKNPEKAASVNRAVASEKSPSSPRAAAPQVESQSQNSAREVLQSEQQSVKQNSRQSAQPQTTNAPDESSNPPVAARNVNKTASAAPAAPAAEFTPETTVFKVEFVDGRAQIEAPGLNTSNNSATNKQTGHQFAESNVGSSSARQNASARNDRPAQIPLNNTTTADSAADSRTGSSPQQVGRESEVAQPNTKAHVQAHSQSDSARVPARADVQTPVPAANAPRQAEIVLDAPLRDGLREILPRTLRIDLDGNAQSTANTAADAPARAANALARLASLLSVVRELGGDIRSIRITAAPAETPIGGTSGAQSGYLQPPALSSSVIQALRDIAAGRPAPLQTVSVDSGTPLAAASNAQTDASNAAAQALRGIAPGQTNPLVSGSDAEKPAAQDSPRSRDVALPAARPANENSQANGSRAAATGKGEAPVETSAKPAVAPKVAASAAGEPQVAPRAEAAEAPTSRRRNAELKTAEPAQSKVAPLKQEGVQSRRAAQPKVESAPVPATEAAAKSPQKPAADQSATVRPVEAHNAQRTTEQIASHSAAPQSATKGEAGQAASSPQTATNGAVAANGRGAQVQSTEASAQSTETPTHSTDVQPPKQQAVAEEKSSAKPGLNRRVATQASLNETASPHAVQQTDASAPPRRAQSGDVRTAAKAETASPVERNSKTAAPQAHQPEVKESAAPRVNAQSRQFASAKSSAEGGNAHVPAAAPESAPQAAVQSVGRADVNNADARGVKNTVQPQTTKSAVFIENANQDNNGGKRQVAHRDVAAPRSPSATSAEGAQPKDKEPLNPPSPRQAQGDKSAGNNAVDALAEKRASVKQNPQREVLQPTNQKSANRPPASPVAAETSTQPRGFNAPLAEAGAQTQTRRNNTVSRTENAAETKTARPQAQSESAASRPAETANASQTGRNTQPARSVEVVAQEVPTQPHSDDAKTGQAKTAQADQPLKNAQNQSDKSQSPAAPLNVKTSAPTEFVNTTVAAKQAGVHEPEALTQPEVRSARAKQQSGPSADAAQQQPVKSGSENVQASVSRGETTQRGTSGESEVKAAPQVKNSESASVRSAARDAQVNTSKTAAKSEGQGANNGAVRAATTDKTGTDAALLRTENAATKNTTTPDPLDSGSVINKKVKPETTPAPEVARSEVPERAVQTPAREVKNAGAEHRPKPAAQQAEPAIKQTRQPEQPAKEAGDALNKASSAKAPEAESREQQAEVKNQPRVVNRTVDTPADTRRGAALDIAAEVFRKSAKTMADPTGSTEMLRRAAEQLRRSRQPVRPTVPPVKTETPRVERVPLRPSAETGDVQIANVPLKQPSANATEQVATPLLNNGFGAETLAMFAGTAAEEQRPAQEQAQQRVQERRAEQNKVQQQNVAPRAAEEAAARELRPRTVVHEKSFNDPAVPRVSDQSALDGEESSGDGSGKQSGNYTGEQKGEQSGSRQAQQAELQAAAQQSVNNGAPQRFDDVLREQAQARRAFASAPTAVERRTVEGRAAARAGTGHERVMKTLRRVAVHRWADTTFGALRTLPAGRGAAIAMTLNPENLGSVMVELTVNKGVASIKIQTERAETRRILEQHAVALKDKLVQSGMSVDNLEINVRDGDLRQDARGELAGDRRRNEREEQSARQEFVDSFRYLREDEAAPPRPAERVPAAAAADGFERYA